MSNRVLLTGLVTAISLNSFPRHLVVKGVDQDQPGLATTGSYRVLVDNKPVGWERFEIVQGLAGFTVKSTSEITHQGSARRLTTTTDAKNDRVVRYSVEVSEGGKARSYTVDFVREGARVRVESAGRTSQRSVRVHDDVVVLDRNVWYQYRYLLGRYDLKERGKQQFHIFIPQAALREVSAEVEFKGATSFGSGSSKKNVNRFQVLLADGFEINAIADESGVPLSIEVPALDTKVILE